MKGVVISYRRGRHTQRNNQMLIRVDGVDTKEKAVKLIGKKVVWKSRKAVINGKVSGVHGSKGVVRAVFEKGMPGQSLAKEVTIE